MCESIFSCKCWGLSHTLTLATISKLYQFNSAMDDERDLWISDDEDGDVDSDQLEDDTSSDPTAFSLSLMSQSGQEGGEPKLACTPIRQFRR